MELYNQKLCLTISELVPAVMTKSNYDYHTRKGNIKVARTARGLGHYALIEYDSLPERFKKKYVELYGDPHVEMKEQNKTPFSLDGKARAFYETYQLPCGSYLPSERIDAYTLNASVLNYTIVRLEEMRRLRKAGHNVRTPENDVWVCYAAEYEQLRTDYRHTLPCSIKTLRNKLSDYRRHGYDSLIDKKLGNSNTVKISDEGGRYIIALRMSANPRYDTNDILSLYNEMAAKKGWKPLKSTNSVLNYLNRADVMPVWYAAVYGEVEAKQRFVRKNRTIMPLHRDALWYGDGTKLNLYYRRHDDKRGWVMDSVQVYEVIDAMSEMLLGYHISDTENYEAQYKAFRMAVERAGCRPYEIVVDNQGGHKKLMAQGFFNRLCTCFRVTQPRNPQSKTIEQLFGRFQTQILAKIYGFTGTNITAKHGGEINMELLTANIDALPTYNELRAIYKEARESWNAMTHPHRDSTRIAVYDGDRNPATEQLTDALHAEMFYFRNDRPSTFTDSGITIQVDGKKHSYEPLLENGMPDMTFRRKYTGAQFIVKYDPLNLSKVKLYRENSVGELVYISDAAPYVMIHRALQDQQPGERAYIGRLLEAQKMDRVARQIDSQAVAMEWGTAPEQQGLRTPKMGGISSSEYERLADLYHDRKANKQRLTAAGIQKELSNISVENLRDNDWSPSAALDKI